MKTEAQKKSQRHYMQERHREFRAKLDEIKLASGCVDCPRGTIWPAIVLQFDHMDPSKKRFKIAQAGGFSWDVILEEISKCVVRCANHHAIKTAIMKEHGRKPLEESIAMVSTIPFLTPF